ncbi:MAG: hypothetical protein ABIR37_01115 [Candidatus Saccharimonadales bacterium]
MKRNRIIAALFACLLLTLSVTALSPRAYAANEFSLQVTPSPLVTTVKPGVFKEVDLKIRNASSATEQLKIEARSFTFDSKSGDVKLRDTISPDIAPWLSFSAATFSVKPGEWYTQKVRINLPKESGFSYSFALLISRQNNPSPTEGGRLLKGSVAVFSLVNVDRPGATRKLEVPSFKASHGIYEFLPASFNLEFKNAGNTIVQPYGNVYIQRSSKDKNPITTLPVNETRAYILPGSSRTLESSWNDGFPAFQTTPNSNGGSSQKLAWNFEHISHFRIGRYTAKLVAVYNDGQRDVPIEAEVSFWVIPWKTIILIIFALAALWYFGHWRNKRRTQKAVRRALASRKTEHHDFS